MSMTFATDVNINSSNSLTVDKFHGNAFAIGTCSTAAGTAAKVVTLDDTSWTLRKGACIAVKFTNTNTAAAITLNVNNTGAKSVYYGEAVLTGTAAVSGGTADRYIYYMYDGTYWVFAGASRDLDTASDQNVEQSRSTSEKWRKVLLHNAYDNSASDVAGTAVGKVYACDGVSVNPLNGKLRASSFILNDHVNFLWNSTDECIDFIFSYGYPLTGTYEIKGVPMS